MKLDNWWNQTKNLGNFFYWGWTFDDWTNPARLYSAHFIDDGDTVLEIGPGSGIDYQVLLIQRPNCRYLALDVSHGFIEAFKERFPEVNGRVVLSNVDVTRQGFLPFSDGSVDVVFARHVIDHCEYYQKPILELLRIVKKRIIFTLWVGLGPAGSGDRIHYNDDNCWTNTYDRGPFFDFLSSTVYWVHGRRLSETKWEQVFVVDKQRTAAMDVKVDDYFDFRDETKEQLDEKYRRFVDERRELARLRSS